MHEGSVLGGKYRLGRLLGEGAMGAVWAARNEMTERDVAIKLILDKSPELSARLLREARACGRVSHRNVVEVYDVGQTDAGEPFLVMQLLAGETLAERLRREKPLPAPLAAHIASEIARGLGAAHRAGIVHRDLKPANVFLHEPADSDEVVVKVVDFGVSKLTTDQDSTATSTGMVLGSPAYMSPEQARGERQVDGRADLWALGVTLFEMLVGRRPFRGDTPYMVVNAVLGDPIPSVRDLAPHLHPALADVVTACLERDLARRIPTADALIDRIQPFSSGPASLAPVLRPRAPAPQAAVASVAWSHAESGRLVPPNDALEPARAGAPPLHGGPGSHTVRMGSQPMIVPAAPGPPAPQPVFAAPARGVPAPQPAFPPAPQPAFSPAPAGMPAPQPRPPMPSYPSQNGEADRSGLGAMSQPATGQSAAARSSRPWVLVAVIALLAGAALGAAVLGGVLGDRGSSGPAAGDPSRAESAPPVVASPRAPEVIPMPAATSSMEVTPATSAGSAVPPASSAAAPTATVRPSATGAATQKKPGKSRLSGDSVPDDPG